MRRDTTATAAAPSDTPAASTAVDDESAPEESGGEIEVLVEEISIDGMCGVY